MNLEQKKLICSKIKQGKIDIDTSLLIFEYIRERKNIEINIDDIQNSIKNRILSGQNIFSILKPMIDYYDK